MSGPALIDTHAHLDDDRFKDDLPAVIERARQAGVEHVIAVATTLESTLRIHALRQQHRSFLRMSAGIHPNHAAEARPTDWDQIVSIVGHSDAQAVGETGLDRHWDFTPFHIQEDYFARHLALSRSTKRPVIIHCREADADVLRMLRDEFDRHGPIKGVMHSFVGSRETATACLEMGLYISFAGMLTYKSAGDLREVAATLPLDRLLVETDSPYLPPVPHRGKRNEPSYVTLTAACLANAQGIDLSTLAEQTTRNARLLFLPE